MPPMVNGGVFARITPIHIDITASFFPFRSESVATARAGAMGLMPKKVVLHINMYKKHMPANRKSDLFILKMSPPADKSY